MNPSQIREELECNLNSNQSDCSYRYRFCLLLQRWWWSTPSSRSGFAHRNLWQPGRSKVSQPTVVKSVSQGKIKSKSQKKTAPKKSKRNSEYFTETLVPDNRIAIIIHNVHCQWGDRPCTFLDPNTTQRAVGCELFIRSQETVVPVLALNRIWNEIVSNR